jgi:four helix bundle protein
MTWLPAGSPRSTSFSVRPYEKIRAWRACHDLALQVYRASSSFPDDERFGLRSQARRAAYSAAANIAEGSAKFGPAEFRRFLDISLGSLAELAYLVQLCLDLGYLQKTEAVQLEITRDHASKLTWGLHRSLGKRKTTKGGQTPFPQ